MVHRPLSQLSSHVDSTLYMSIKSNVGNFFFGIRRNSFSVWFVSDMYFDKCMSCIILFENLDTMYPLNL